MTKLAFVIAALGACHTSSSTPTPDPTPSPTPTPTPTKGGAIAEKCSDTEPCAPGLECVSYYGIAGPRGPKFQTCEIRCDKNKDTVCPPDKQCVTVADGPGKVCR